MSEDHYKNECLCMTFNTYKNIVSQLMINLNVNMVVEKIS